MGIGGFLLFMEFKTPGFGIFGYVGATMLCLVFAGKYAAGLAGHEEMLLFLIGTLLIFIELLVFPGTLILGITGALMAMGSLLWAMADIWPTSDFQITPALFHAPLIELAKGLSITGIGIYFALRFLPNTWIGQVLILKEEVHNTNKAISGGGSSLFPDTPLPEVGERGVTTSDLFPSGKVSINGHIFEAKSSLGLIKKGAEIEVVDHHDFNIMVKSI